MAHTFEELLDGNIGTRCIDPSAFQKLWTNDESNAAAYVPIDQGRFILAENSSYEPSREPEWKWLSDEAPFNTDGKQLLLDLTKQRYAMRGIHYEEGDVQGLVYALEAMTYGGNLAPEDYVERITHWVKEFDDSYRWETMGKEAVAKYVDLNFIMSVEAE